jgi:hypothetical protein
MPDTNTGGCRDCVDGMVLSFHAIEGACWRTCRTCQTGCACCDGRGFFPVWTHDLLVFLVAYNVRGIAPILCHSCIGVVDITLIPEEDM